PSMIDFSLLRNMAWIALTQGAIQAMFLSKLKSIMLGLVTAAFAGSGVGFVSYRALAGETYVTSKEQEAAAPQRGQETDPAKLRQEIDRLRAELDKTRLELQRAEKRIRELQYQSAISQAQSRP